MFNSSPAVVDPVVAEDRSASSHLQDEKDVGGVAATANDTDSNEEEFSKDVQAGVLAIEATTSVWSRRDLILAYILIWCVYFMDAMQQTTSNSLTPFVTSAFSAHSLTAATSIMSSLIGGLFKLSLAKILDIWGRPQGFAAMTFLLVIGLIMMAVCQNVQTYAAAQVFYWVGYDGMSFCLSIFIADTSALKNRAFALAFISSPYIATVWIGGPLAQALLDGPGFRWGFGIFAILEFVTALPLLALFIYNFRKASKLGLIPARNSGRNFMQTLKFYAVEFDLVGLLLITGGLALFLLPFSLYSYQGAGWKAPMIYLMITFGGLLCIAFVFWEKYIAPKKFLPYELLKDRTILGACMLAMISFIEFYIWDSYFYSFLLVVNNLDVTKATYVVNIYTIGSCFWGLVVGVYIRWSGKFKNLAMFFGVPLTILGVALMVNFRQPDVNIGYIVMCQIFIAFGGGTLVICQQMAVMSATTHQYVAVVLAMEAMFSSVGGAIGATVAGAIWTGVFPEKLAKYLPEDQQANLTTIYESITVQESFAVGSATRDAVNQAYGDAQRIMLIAASCILIGSIISVAVWRDYQVKDHKQTKGRVF